MNNTDLKTLRDWAEGHARAGSKPWQMVTQLFADYDRRGQLIDSLAARAAAQSELLSRRAEYPQSDLTPPQSTEVEAYN